MEPNRIDIDIVNQSCRIYQAVDFKGYSIFLFSFILNSCTEEFLLEEIILPYNIKYPTDSSETPRNSKRVYYKELLSPNLCYSLSDKIKRHVSISKL